MDMRDTVNIFCLDNCFLKGTVVPFLFSHRLQAATASPQGKRWALPRRGTLNGK